MPDLIPIDRDQRDGLYELVRNHLGSIEDFWVALERTRDYETAQRLGEEFGADFLLLRDIGWRPSEERELYALIMPRQDLTALLRRLHDEAAQVLLGAAAESSREDSETNRRSSSATRPAGRCWPISISRKGADPCVGIARDGTGVDCACPMGPRKLHRWRALAGKSRWALAA